MPTSNLSHEAQEVLAMLCGANGGHDSIGGNTCKIANRTPKAPQRFLDLGDLAEVEAPVDERTPEGESEKQGLNHSLTRGAEAHEPSHSETIAPFGLPSRFDLSPYQARVKAALADPKWAKMMGDDLVHPAASLCKVALGPTVPPVTDLQARLVMPHMGHLKTPTAAALHAINQQKAEAAAKDAKKTKGKDKGPVGLPMTDGAQQAAGFQAGSQPGTGTSVGPGNSPSSHPITSYSGLGAPGTVNGNAAFGTRHNSLGHHAKTGSLNMNTVSPGSDAYPTSASGTLAPTSPGTESSDAHSADHRGNIGDTTGKDRGYFKTGAAAPANRKPSGSHSEAVRNRECAQLVPTSFVATESGTITNKTASCERAVSAAGGETGERAQMPMAPRTCEANGAVLLGSILHKSAAGPLTAEELAWFQQQPGVENLLGSLGMEIFEGKLKPQVLKKGGAAVDNKLPSTPTGLGTYTTTIDRPQGFKKTFPTPAGPQEHAYPVDYGYINELINPDDNEGLDVFLGKDGPNYGRFMKGNNLTGQWQPDERKWYARLTDEQLAQVKGLYDAQSPGLLQDFVSHPDEAAFLVDVATHGKPKLPTPSQAPMNSGLAPTSLSKESMSLIALLEKEAYNWTPVAYGAAGAGLGGLAGLAGEALTGGGKADRGKRRLNWGLGGAALGGALGVGVSGEAVPRQDMPFDLRRTQEQLQTTGNRLRSTQAQQVRDAAGHAATMSDVKHRFKDVQNAVDALRAQTYYDDGASGTIAYDRARDRLNQAWAAFGDMHTKGIPADDADAWGAVQRIANNTGARERILGTTDAYQDVRHPVHRLGAFLEKQNSTPSDYQHLLGLLSGEKEAGIVGDIARHPVTPFVAQPVAGAGVSFLLNELLRRGAELYTGAKVPKKQIKRERIMSLGMGAGMGLARAAAPYAARSILESTGDKPALL